MPSDAKMDGGGAHTRPVAGDHTAKCYEQLKAAAARQDEAARLDLAARAETPPEVLYFLASDEALSVRAAVARNTATPAQADSRLARDPDDRVRMVLARKLAALTPALTAADRTRLGHHVWTNLALLVDDEIARVRAVVADLVKDMPHAPRDLILRLAQDATHSVSDPVLRLSPVLTQDDLLGLLACAPGAEAARSIAHRVDVTEALADAIARTADTAAIRSLLANRSAAIRESTLDALVARAADRVEWHEPLVHRPRLSPTALRTLSSMIATDLLETLTRRPDIDPLVVRELEDRLHRRLAHANPLGAPDPAARVHQALGRARALHDAGTLDEAALIEAIRLGCIEDVCVMIAVAADVPVAAVQRAADLRGAKAIVSLVRKAGLPMRVAPAVQALLGNIPPGALLRPNANGGFPLTEAEMAWQVDFVTRGRP